MNVGVKNHPEFMDLDDEVAFGRLLSSMKKKGIKNYKMTVELIDKSTITRNQLNLYKVLVSKVSEESGQDFDTTESTLLANALRSTSLESADLTMYTQSQFELLLNNSILFCREFFNLSVEFDKNGFIEIKQI